MLKDMEGLKMKKEKENPNKIKEKSLEVEINKIKDPQVQKVLRMMRGL